MGAVTDYLAGIDDDARRAALEHVIALARHSVPEVEEGVSYAMPVLLYRGKPLIAAIATKHHLAIYPFSGTVVHTVAPDLDGFSLSKGTIRFDVDRPVPDAVLTRIIELRLAELD
ncbi:MAG: iron chaperone [Intrasporangium sp.]|uniref:iron chaperone n=1 Tax=Intrasporangium sp. TaxID=1925024 RepID=UPI003F7ECF0C